MTTKVTIKNENQGAPYADWDIGVAHGTEPATVLKPGESKDFSMWHDGRELRVWEIPK